MCINGSEWCCLFCLVVVGCLCECDLVGFVMNCVVKYWRLFGVCCVE